ncbi:1,4-alpha-glucan branching enzyme GlgB 1 [Novosphingobium marinum]|uniref:1,4-alpha-glucan branching enzyme GlgB n=1 Tax=Novosphingobium marinum TaxID=1514948 RepID=A0A7Y9XXW8_9SPHN|nr:1,4-alpha-glucan branching protein GlgB [Novosphingobium marinum]NYH95288.1 1,4-alpha-glucan branching enzyme [Novosphingobium marinum]GGC25845.1 1,4-alpha-glucan branching enzyme GlgB 1 [Novosphingobium marinum]
MTAHDNTLGLAASAVLEGRLDDPFALLGPHREGDAVLVRTFQPGAEAVEAIARKGGKPLGMLEEVAHGLFSGRLGRDEPYRLKITWPGGTVQETEDPYAFGVVLSDFDLHLFSEGRHFELGNAFGAQPTSIDGVEGTAFSVWAPNARRVSVVGDFNQWDGRRHPMRLRHSAGVWELFLPRIGPGARYKFEVAGADGGIVQKADPLARQTEAPPATGSVVAAKARYAWTDSDWMEERARRHGTGAPISIYEVHAGSWMKPEGEGDRALDWRGLSDRLLPYVADMGFTHVELLPIMEHPFGGSWGYQPLSQFAPSARFGKPEDFAAFVDAAHRAGIGVILDWVPAHFPTDAHGLAHFDGTHLYEHSDPREGFHQDWNTLIYNLGRNEVSGFLLASAMWWLETFHIDGLRVDAVASMLYRDYSREAGQWVPNVHGGRENLESVAFLKHLNAVVGERCPGAMTIAEESTAWPGVTAPVPDGGLGFDYKWNMGWMHDTLQYIERDPVHRRWHHGELTFPMVYAYSEKYVLPISHDEVVHGKGSLWNKMPGDRWRKFANLRAYLAFMWTHPGKKLLFMGCELGMEPEWNHDEALPWHLLDQPEHAAVQKLLRDLNRLYRAEPSLHERDTEPGGFQWLVGDDADNSVFAFARYGGGAPVVAAFNMTPEPREGYCIGLPGHGRWTEVLNSDAEGYGGSNTGNGGSVHADGHGLHGQDQSAAVTLPPLGAVILRHEGA